MSVLSSILWASSQHICRLSLQTSCLLKPFPVVSANIRYNLRYSCSQSLHWKFCHLTWFPFSYIFIDTICTHGRSPFWKKQEPQNHRHQPSSQACSEHARPCLLQPQFQLQSFQVWIPQLPWEWKPWFWDHFCVGSGLWSRTLPLLPLQQ